MMCYQSFTWDEFTIGASYVFPLTMIDYANPNDSFSVLTLLGTEPTRESPSYKTYALPVCSHTSAKGHR